MPEVLEAAKRAQGDASCTTGQVPLAVSQVPPPYAAFYCNDARYQDRTLGIMIIQLNSLFE